MDAKTLEALQDSILKWEKIVAGTGEDRGADNCALCQMFNLGRPMADRCQGCPVHAHTGKQFCRGTPLDDRDETTNAEREMELAIEELDFLRSLLPPEK